VDHFDGATPPCPFNGVTPSSCSSAAAPSSFATTSYSANTTTVTDEASVSRINTNDGLGRLASVQENPSGGSTAVTTTYTYDFGDRLKTVNQGSQPARTFAYDALGRLTSATNLESGTTSYNYDGNGNLTLRSPPTASISTNYDHLNRVISKIYSSSTTYTAPNVTYCYDGNANAAGCSGTPTGSLLVDRLTMVQNSNSTTKFLSYDTLGRVLGSQQITAGITYPFSYGYNQAGLLTSITYPPPPGVSTGRQITYTFDDANRYTAVCGTFQSNTTSYTGSACSQSTAPSSPIVYSAHGAVTGVTFGGTLAESTMFNSRLQPTQIQAGSLLTLGYSFSSTQNNGNILGQTINDGVNPVKTQSYGYDAVNRLTTANEGSTWAQTYVYDTFGNRALLGISTDPSVGVDKILLPATSSTSSVPFTNNRWTGVGVQYDNGQSGARGNLTSVQVDANDSFSAVYDAENRNTSVTTVLGGTSQTVNYGYDGDGKRITKSIVGGAAITFVYDAQGLLAQEYGSPADSGTEYLTADHLGSTRLVSTITSGVASAFSRSDYLPFGQEIPATWNRPNYVLDTLQRIKFTSKERDAETGLDFSQARYLSGAQGRFTSPDPSNLSVDFWVPQSWNRYSYAINNPLAYVDRNGLWPTWIHNQIINEAFPGLSAQQLQTLRTASHDTDYNNKILGSSPQDPAVSFVHSLSNGTDPDEAHALGLSIQLADQFVQSNEANARASQAEWIASGHTGVSPNALTTFGNALHTVTDATSPAHAGFQGWSGAWLPAIVHVAREFRFNLTGAERDNAISAARSAYLDTFGLQLYLQAVGERPLTPKVESEIKFGQPVEKPEDNQNQ
jgi:RHS repeat-associated protein